MKTLTTFCLLALGLSMSAFCQDMELSPQDIDFVPQAPKTVSLWQGEVPLLGQPSSLANPAEPALKLVYSSRKQPYLSDLALNYGLSEVSKISFGGRIEDGLQLQSVPMNALPPRELQDQSLKGYFYARFEARF